MTRIATGPNDSTETQPGGVQNNELVFCRELNEWWRIILEISTEIRSPELRTKFLAFANSEREAKDQYAQVLHEKNKIEYEALIESATLKQEIDKLKEAFAAAQHQIDGLQQQLSERGTVRSRDEVAPRKRQRIECTPDSEEEEEEEEEEEGEDFDEEPPRRAFGTGVTRDQICDIMGGADRGWCSKKSRSGTGYTYHVLLDMDLHFFGKNPSHGQGVAEAVFGFGKMDNAAISGAIGFPLFVRASGTYRFTYMGNYTAVKLYPVAWNRMSNEAKGCVIRTVLSNGLSAECNLRKLEQGMTFNEIRHQFQNGTYKVPRSRLEFQFFDEDLNAKIKNSTKRRE